MSYQLKWNFYNDTAIQEVSSLESAIKDILNYFLNDETKDQVKVNTQESNLVVTWKSYWHEGEVEAETVANNPESVKVFLENFASSLDYDDTFEIEALS